MTDKERKNERSDVENQKDSRGRLRTLLWANYGCQSFLMWLILSITIELTQADRETKKQFVSPPLQDVKLDPIE